MLKHGPAGGIVAGTLFVLPSVFILLGLSWLYAAYGNLSVIFTTHVRRQKE